MTTVEKIADLSVLWKQASLVFPFFDRRPADFEEAYRVYLAKVLDTKSDGDFHLVMAEFINLLGDGHTDYTPPESLMKELGSLPFSLRYVQGGYCVRAIKAGGELHLGAQIRSINGKEIQQWIGELCRYSYHVDDFISRPNLFLPFLLKKTGNHMETTEGTYCFDLEMTAPDMIEIEKPRVSRSHMRIPSEKLEIRIYEDRILYVRMDDFLYRGAAEEIAAVLRARSDFAGVILDVRNNIGGMTKFAASVAELFISGEFHSLRKHTRKMTGADLASAGQLLLMSEEDRKKWCDEEELERCRRVSGGTYYNEWVDTVGVPEQQAIYTGPCVILTSRYTVSAAEDFVAMFRSTERGIVMGESTQGTTGTPLLLRLSGGGRARICSIGNRLMDGTEFIGIGIQPDLFKQQSVRAYAAGEDTVLEAALSRFP